MTTQPYPSMRVDDPDDLRLHLGDAPLVVPALRRRLRAAPAGGAEGRVLLQQADRQLAAPRPQLFDERPQDRDQGVGLFERKQLHGADLLRRRAPSRPRCPLSFQRFVVVTGLSGAGKSQAMKSFEDLGFHCLDNLPPRMAVELVALCEEAGVARLALALDVRSHGPFGEAQDALAQLTARGIAYEVLFLDAGDATIVRRYSETRRRHPFETAGVLMNAIAAERAALADLRDRANRIWDTSGMTHAMLKARIAAAYADGPQVPRLITRIVAFGFKFGIPLDADLVFDVRFLPESALRRRVARSHRPRRTRRALHGVDPGHERVPGAPVRARRFPDPALRRRRQGAG